MAPWFSSSWPRATAQLIWASLRLFVRAPATALPLWAVGTLTCFALDRGAAQQLRVVAGNRAEHGRLALALATALAGWASDCLLQALWARLVWQVHHGGATDISSLWRQLRGAWTSIGVMVAYASLAAAAWGWPLFVAGLGRLQHHVAWAIAAAALVLGLGYGVLRTMLAVPAAASEQLGGRAAWASSWRLTRGRGAQLALLMLLGSAAALAVSKVGACLPDLWPGQPVMVTALACAVQCALGGLPGTIYWAWLKGRSDPDPSR